MYDGAMQFLVILGSKLLTIGLHGVKTDEEVSADGIALGIVKGDDVRVVIMLQIL